MTIDAEQMQQREAEQARQDERNERYERFCQPPDLPPRPKTLRTRMMERFEIMRCAFGMRVSDNETVEHESFTDNFWGGVSAGEWMLERMGETK